MANWFGSALKASKDTAHHAGESVGEAASGLAIAAKHFADKMGQTIRSTTSGLTTAAGKTVDSLSHNIGTKTVSLVSSIKEWHPFSNDETMAFFAVLFAVAAADQQIDEAELRMILASPEAQKLSAKERQTLQSYSYNPPPLEESIQALAGADPQLKFGLIFCILNLVRINDKMTPAEEAAIALTQTAFEINDAQLQAIRDYIQVLAESAPALGTDAIPAIEAAADRMKSVGIPIKSLAYSQEHAMTDVGYSDEKFLEKMKAFGLQSGRLLVEQAYVMWYALKSTHVPNSAKLVIAGALAYWILPVDMIPDVLPAVGFTDDFTTIATALTTVAMSITPDIRTKARVQTQALFNGQDEFNQAAIATHEDNGATS